MRGGGFSYMVIMSLRLFAVISNTPPTPVRGVDSPEYHGEILETLVDDFKVNCIFGGGIDIDTYVSRPFPPHRDRAIRSSVRAVILTPSLI